MMDYKDTNLSTKSRVEDLISRMTLKEKVGQLNQKLYGWDAYKRHGDSIELTDIFKEEVANGGGMGALYGLFRSDPWSEVTYKNGIPTEKNAQVANMVQRYVRENTRLGIPVLLSEECPHGHQALDGTLTPTNIGIGCTWNPELMEEAYSHVAAEVRSRGAHLGLISTLDILRDPRWGRSEECFSEDPFLTSEMTVAAVKGFQGDGSNLDKENKIIAVLKHLAAQGDGEGGHNAGSVNIGERELREIHLPAMKAAVSAGALGCMAAYNEIDGIPCHSNTKLLTDILRDEWLYEGIVMADGVAIDRLNILTGDYELSASLALTAGVDLSLWDNSFTTLEAAVLNGKVSEDVIDRAVRRVLNLKFCLGLFDKPYVDESLSKKTVGSEPFNQVNLQVARESVVLLKNESNILPLDRKIQNVAIIGPNADDLYNQLGDYTAIQSEGKGVTVLQGIKEMVDGVVTYAKGCGVRSNSTEGFDEAIRNAEKSDVIVLVLGGSSKRNFDINFDSNGAAIISGDTTEMNCGEGVDISNLKLDGVQEKLVEELAKTGKPIVAVLIQGRPHALSGIIKHCDALLCGWYPGQQGGRAMGEILFGEVNPSGKLSVSMARSSSQLPVFYNYKGRDNRLNYVDGKSSPLFPFGYGLSYTQFEYSDIKLKEENISLMDLHEGKNVELSVEVKNVGAKAGAEIVQLYIQDLEATVSRRVKELKGFKKIWLEPGETKTVKLQLGKEALSIWDTNMAFVVEPGNIKIMIGASSCDVADVNLKINA